MNTSHQKGFQLLSHWLARQWHGKANPGVPDWIDRSFVQSLSMPLDGGAVRVALCDGANARNLPSHVIVRDTRLELRACRTAHARLQAAVRMERDAGTRLRGSATALVADRRNAERHYLLTCGHVAAPDGSVRHGDSITIDAETAMRGYLVEWQPAIGDGALRTPLDAALVEISAGDARSLGRNMDWLPTGVGGRALRDHPVTLRGTTGVVPGVMKVFWSGAVDIPGVSPGVADYFLVDAIGYSTAQPTIGGDSGAPVWDADDRLMGMHLGEVEGGDGEVNAVFGPIGPVLEWFDVEPWLRGGPTMPPPAGAPETGARGTRTPARTTTSVADECTVVAQTLWGEARGEGDSGLRAVAAVIANRRAIGHRGCTTAAAVCLSFRQFSCWNEGDPNRAQMEQVVTHPDHAYRLAHDIATELLQGTLFARTGDPTRGATHYVASTLRKRPSWLHGKSPCAVIGRHEFYKDID